MSAIDVRAERGRRERRAFLDLPYRLYQGQTGFVPPLRLAEAALQDRRKNPFFQHSEAEHFLAWRGGRVVGRIAAIENRRHNEVHGERVGFFGFLDVEPDPEATRALLDAAGSWCAGRGLRALRGPTSYSTNDVCGALVAGFEEPPALQMPWNRPDLDGLVQGAGLAPVKDLVAYWLDASAPAPERFARVVARRLERSEIRLRPLDLARFDGEVEVLRDLYNRSWERNWGFVPATEAEFRHAAKDLKQVVSPELSAVAEQQGRPVGFCAVLRDVNRLLAPTGRGRLLPTNLLRLLFGMKRIRRYRVIALGVVPEARGKAVNEAFFLHAHAACRRLGHEGAEASWILADNERMRAPIEAMGGVVTKTYRLYERPLNPSAG
jgi:GNAT superfamily N-acetyltransferase